MSDLQMFNDFNTKQIKKKEEEKGATHKRN